MKKLLYTLLIGLVIVSCQKEEYGGDYAPAALSTDIEAVSGLNKQNIESSVNRLIDKLPNIKKGTASTAKTPVQGSYLLFLLAGDSSIGYEIFLGDDVSACGAADDFSKVYLVYQSASQTTVHVGTADAEVFLTLDVDLTSAMSADNLILGDKIDYVAQTITPAAGSNNSITFD